MQTKNLGNDNDFFAAIPVTSPSNPSEPLEDSWQIFGNGGNDTLFGDLLADTIDGGSGSDNLNGDFGNDSLIGGSGNDTLNGGEGNDTMRGGLDNDTYVVNTAGDIVTENANEGLDTVQASINYTLTANVENLTLTGTSALSGTGNNLNNLIIGNSGSNTLNGATGTDTMQGGAGNDTYMVDSLADVVTESANQGTDTIQTTIGYTLGANVENLTLLGTAAISGTGNTLNNLIIGNSANNTLDGGTGLDSLRGEAGNDTYIINNAATTAVFEEANEGIDAVQASVSYTLRANFENLTLTGSSATSGSGNSLNNLLIGNSADNTLNGQAGNDTMQGGAGNDTYIVDSAADIVTEGSNQGIDTVQASVSYTLSANVENLKLSSNDAFKGIGNSLNNHLTGSDLVNHLLGGSGHDTLDGGKGGDILEGGTGNDTYFIDSENDIILERENEGIDTLIANTAYELGDHQENLTLVMDNTYRRDGLQFDGKGNNLNNLIVLDSTLVGNSTKILGEGGNDTLQGSITPDRLFGGEGNDLLQGQDNNDNLFGEAGDDQLYGGEGDDFLQGGFESFNSNAPNDNGSDTLFGGAGRDSLEGQGGSDALFGGEGNDRLTGANFFAQRPGVGEIDTLNGGTGADEFILAKSQQSFYDDGDDTTAGLNDYALIQDFNTNEDLIRLQGTANQYVLGDSPIAGVAGTAILRKTGGVDELVAIIQGSTNLDLTASYFQYIGSSSASLTEVEVPTEPALLPLHAGHTSPIPAPLPPASTSPVTNAADEFVDDPLATLLYPGARWNSGGGIGGQLGTPVTITYSFMTDVPAGYPVTRNPDGSVSTIEFGRGTASGFQQMTNAEKQLARQALQTYADVANITFQEVSNNNGGGMLQFGLSDLPSGFSGFGNPPLAGFGDRIGDIWIDTSTGFSTYIHEIGHALGLKHPTREVADDIGPFLPTEKAHVGFSALIGSAITPQLYDILAIQHLYGVRTNTRLGDNTYTNPNDSHMTIYDNGGIDVISADDHQQRVEIDLRSGTHSFIGIANGVNIENAIGGRGDDTLTGNDLENFLVGGGGHDSIDGLIGNDTLYGATGDDTLDGYFGRDLLEGQEGHDLLRGGPGSDTLKGGSGNDTLDGSLDTDTLSGGSGDDTYLVTSGDVIIESANGGIDTVETTDSFTLGNHIENLNLKSLGNLAFNTNGTGNALNNIITGTTGNNRLDGLEGNDTLDGGDGHDTLLGGLGNDSLVGGTGNDQLLGVLATAAIPGANEVDVLLGGTGNDMFILGTQANTQVFYNGLGNNDFAIIADFAVAEDKIQIKGDFSNYTLRNEAHLGSSSLLDTAIYFTANGANDLIALVQDTVGLTAQSFQSII
jgi:Ca2+-binding RTX toxin-like protein